MTLALDAKQNSIHSLEEIVDKHSLPEQDAWIDHRMLVPSLASDRDLGEDTSDSDDLTSVLSNAEHAALLGANSLTSPRNSTTLRFQCPSHIPEISISFSGAGLCGFYFNGICKQLVERRVRIGKVYGASAGALAGLSLLLNAPSDCHEEILRLYDQHRSCTPWILLKGRDFTWESQIVKKQLLPVDDPELCRRRIQNQLNGRLHVAITRVCGWDRDSNNMFVIPRSITVSEWEDRQDLVDCIKATMSIPGITCLAPFYWRGAYWVDGGLLNSQPLPPDAPMLYPRIITVSPWVPCQPWQPSWALELDVFRHLPLLDGVLHTSLERRRQMFEHGVSDAEQLLCRLQAAGKEEPHAAPQPSSRYRRHLRALGRLARFAAVEASGCWPALTRAARPTSGELSRWLDDWCYCALLDLEAWAAAHGAIDHLPRSAPGLPEGGDRA